VDGLGWAKFLLYSDGTLIVTDPQFPSRLGSTLLDHATMTATLAKLSSVDEFWSLSSDYKLSTWSDQPRNVIKVNIPGKRAISVSVYGWLSERVKFRIRRKHSLAYQFTVILEAFRHESVGSGIC